MIRWLRSLFGFRELHAIDNDVIKQIVERQKRIERDLAVLRIQEIDRYRRRGGGGAVSR